MVTLTNHSDAAVDVPLYGIGTIEPGASVEVADELAEAFVDHPYLSVSTPESTPAPAAASEE